MSENENVVVEEPVQPENASEPGAGKRFLAALKEWGRKKLVMLKIKTHFIPLILLAISTIYFYCCLGTLSQAVLVIPSVKFAAFVMFVNSLLTLIALVMFLNAFPKRKKPNLIAVVAVFVLMGLIIGMDIIYYVQINGFIADAYDAYMERYPEFYDAFTCIIVHIVLVGIALVAFATMPLYKKLLNKINTRKELASTDLKEEIDTSAEV